MSTKNKKGPNGSVYLALSLSILLVVCVGIYSLVVNMFAEVPDLNGDDKLRDFVSGKTSKNEITDNSVESDYEIPNIYDSKEVDATPTPVYTLPCNGNIIKEYSGDDLVFSKTMNDYRAHTGIDIASNVGDTVLCFSDGTVESITDDPLMGKTIVIDHGNNLKSVYQNLADDIPSDITVGAKVKTGQVIAAVGDTSLIECAEDTHLHFEILEAGKYISPSDFIS